MDGKAEMFVEELITSQILLHQAEAQAAKDEDVMRRPLPCASLWAVEVKGHGEEHRR